MIDRFASPILDENPFSELTTKDVLNVLQFTILIVARTTEALELTREEIDFKN